MPIGESTMLGLSMRFVVSIDKGDFPLGSWTKADGLDVSWEIAEYRAGDSKNFRWYFPGHTRYSTVRLSRAASVAESKQVRSWLDSNSFKMEYQVGSIALQDAKGESVAEWELRNVLPIKWAIAGFDATQSRVAIETLDLAHVGFLDD